MAFVMLSLFTVSCCLYTMRVHRTVEHCKLLNVPLHYFRQDKIPAHSLNLANKVFLISVTPLSYMS